MGLKESELLFGPKRPKGQVQMMVLLWFSLDAFVCGFLRAAWKGGFCVVFWGRPLSEVDREMWSLEKEERKWFP